MSSDGSLRIPSCGSLRMRRNESLILLRARRRVRARWW
jgi:hypothetical protein